MKKCLQRLHARLHPGGRITSKVLKEKIIRTGIRKDVIRCLPISCQPDNIHCHTGTELNYIQVPGSSFDHVHLELVKNAGIISPLLTDFPQVFSAQGPNS